MGGSPLEAFDFLLGAPSIKYKLDSSPINGKANKAWNIAFAAYSDNYPMVVGTGESPSYSLDSYSNYAILGVYTLTSTSGSTVKLYCIRSPWFTDNSDFSGSYAAGSSNWKYIDTSSLDYYSDDTDENGIIWLTSSEFINVFDYMYIAYYNDDYTNNVYSVTSDDKTVKYYSITLPDTDDVYMGVNLYGDRMYPYGCHTSGSNTGDMYIFGTDGDLLSSLTIADDSSDTAFTYAAFSSLSAGTYYAIVKMNSWGSND